MKVIKINGDDSEILSVELKDVLGCIEHSEKINWGLLWLYATASLDDGRSIVDLEHKINKSETATIVSWEELVKLSSQINQTIEIVVIGDKDASKVRKYSTDEQMYNNCDFTIEMIDSSYWIIHSNDDSFIEGLFDRLQGVEYYDALG